MVKWFREVFNLPILLLEEVDAQIAAQPPRPNSDRSRNDSLKQVIAGTDTSSRTTLQS
jgi:hypothetical protein